MQIGSAAALALSVAMDAKAFEGGGTDERREEQSPQALSRWDLGQLKWQVSGFVPYLWGIDHYTDIREAPDAEIGPIDAPVPGSVQKALLHAGIVKDWNVALNAREMEWVENRDWVYQTEIPDEWISHGSQLRLCCSGLDYAGKILLNGQPVMDFKGSFTPYAVDLKPYLKPSGNLLQIWFQQSPRWLGQFGYTSQMTECKPRFNYYWDWVQRVVQIGIWDSITLEAVMGGEIGEIRCHSDASLESGTGSLQLSAAAEDGRFFQVALKDGDRTVQEETHRRERRLSSDCMGSTAG